MTNNNFILSVANELPSQFAENLGIIYTSTVDKEHKKKNGQFFTPAEIADLMGTYTECNYNSIKILDPGCGTAILSCALIENLSIKNSQLKLIELTVYETDKELIPFTIKSLNYLKNWLQKKQISLQYYFHSNDFILENSDCLKNNGTLFSNITGSFDIIVSNPPYFKLPSDDNRAVAAKEVVNGHPNIYSIFMAISAKLLKENGELIFITPRSYASGSYFKVFREYFFKLIQIDKIHLFTSRKDTFTRDNVLQETLIIKGSRKQKINQDHQVVISSSHGLKDIKNPQLKTFSQKDLIDINSKEKILYLPINDFEESILNIFKNWKGNLNKYNIEISTGPVVSFRACNYIIEDFENGNVPLAPLFWLHNVKQMILEWPNLRPNKGQYIKIQNESKSILIANKNYVLLRRFSSKDDKSRLIAAPYFCNFVDSDFIGVENKVNYIYRPKGHLDRSEIVGLCALLNSNLFDSFFRIFNGNVNVSATELREMPFPPIQTIKEIGNIIILSNDFSVKNINTIVSEQFEFSTTIYE